MISVKDFHHSLPIALIEELSMDCIIPSPLFSEARSIIYTLKSSGRKLHIFTRTIDRVIAISESNDSSHRLFADNIWPGTYVLADFLDSNPSICHSRTVLELGAGCSLPSLVSSIHGASRTVATDYPDDSIIGNIEDVVKTNGIENVVILPYAWGTNPSFLLDAISDISSDDSCTTNTQQDWRQQQYDVILLAEVLWKDTYSFHIDLLFTLQSCLSPSGIVLITIVHRPTTTHSVDKDMEFLSRAKEQYGLQCRYLGLNHDYKDVFEDDRDKHCEVHLYVLFAREDDAYILESIDHWRQASNSDD